MCDKLPRMAVLVSVHNATKSFSHRPLFRNITFSIETGERIGLIGPNGAGKSTLLKIIADAIEPDEGTISRQRGLRVGILEQDPTLNKDWTILQTILNSADPASAPWDQVAKAEELVAKFELGAFGTDALIGSLSGGWRKRVALAREWAKSPDLLLLDEPTNHLDLETILWLEKLLSSANFGLLTITHDRLFLNRISNRILELDPRHPGGLLSVAGDYASFLEVREQRILSQERRETILKNTLRRETEWLRQGAKARTTKQQARITRAGDLKDEVEELTDRNQSRTVRMSFQASEKSPKKLLEAKSLAKSYGPKKIFEDFSLILTPGARLGLIGRNGAGKSTLIRVLTGQEEPSSGTVTRSDHLSIAYFDQNRDALDPDTSVLKTLCPSGETVEFGGRKTHIRSYLDRFLFSTEKMEMEVSRLSGGEKARLLIAQLMLSPANLLVLDEPTNDLDLQTLSVLEECLTDFPGAIILVSHDRYFLDQVSNRLLAFDGPRLETFADVGQWETWVRNQKGPNPKAQAAAKTGTDSAVPAARKVKLSYMEQRELDGMEETILKAEEKLSRLEAESREPAYATDSSKLSKITADMSTAQEEIDRLYARWARLSGN